MMAVLANSGAFAFVLHALSYLSPKGRTTRFTACGASILAESKADTMRAYTLCVWGRLQARAKYHA